MHKYERKCWSCGSKDLEDKGSYVQCKACGTTYNVIPKPGADCITMEPDPVAPSHGTRSGKSPSPSGVVQRLAARARDDEK